MTRRARTFWKEADKSRVDANVFAGVPPGRERNAWRFLGTRRICCLKIKNGTAPSSVSNARPNAIPAAAETTICVSLSTQLRYGSPTASMFADLMQLFTAARQSSAVVCLTLALAALAGRAPAARAAGPLRIVPPTDQLGYFGTEFAVFDAAGRIVTRGQLPGDDGAEVTAFVGGPAGLVPMSFGDPQALDLPIGLSIASPVVQKGSPVIVGPQPNGQWAAFIEEPTTGLRMVSYVGKLADPVAGVRVTWFASHGIGVEPIANEAGDVLMFGYLAGGPAGDDGGPGLWIERPHGPQIVYHPNTPMPGFGARFGDYPSQEIALENTGRVATVHRHASGEALWLFDAPGQVGGRLVARSGVVLRGIPVGSIDDIQMANWRTAFHASYRGLFAESYGIVSLVAGEGQSAPGFGPDAKYDSIQSSATSMNSVGDLAFVADIEDPTLPGGVGTGIWVSKRDQPVEFALDLRQLLGDRLPGFGGPVVRNMAMNDRGQIALWGFGDSEELWWYDPAVGSRQIAALGGEIDLMIAGQQVSKTIETLRAGSFHSSSLSPAPFINDKGEVVFVARFTDQTSATLLWSPVPEPASQWLSASLLIGLKVAAVARRRLRLSADRALCWSRL